MTYKAYNDEGTEFIEFSIPRAAEGFIGYYRIVGWNEATAHLKKTPPTLTTLYPAGTLDSGTFEAFQFSTYEEYWNIDLYQTETINVTKYADAYYDHYRKANAPNHP